MTTTQLEIVPADAGENAKRADAPAIWRDYQERIAALTQTAKTLTVTAFDQRDLMAQAGECRKQLKAIRCEVETKRKELTEYHLRQKQGIDRDAKRIKDLIEPLEQRMLEQETFCERELEKQMLAKKAERHALLAPFCFDPSVYFVEKMSEEAFAQCLSDAKAGHEKRLAEAAAAKAQAEADATERQRIAAENEVLRLEAAKANAARLKAQAELDRQKAEQAKAEQAKLDAEQAKASAPDKAKLVAYADTLLATLPQIVNQEVMFAIKEQMLKAHKWIIGQAEKL